jgi:hypothetical protein
MKHEPATHRLMVNVTEAQYEHLRLSAFRRRTTISALVRELIDKERLTTQGSRRPAR